MSGICSKNWLVYNMSLKWILISTNLESLYLAVFILKSPFKLFSYFEQFLKRLVYQWWKMSGSASSALPGNFSQIFSQEISYSLQEIFVKIVPAKTEVYHHHKQNQTSLKSIYIVGRTFYLWRPQEIFIFDFAARKRNIFSRPVVYS